MGHRDSRLFHGRAICPAPPATGYAVVRGLPLIHDKTVDEWGTEILGYFMTGPSAPSFPGFVVRGLPLIHDKTVDEWGTEILGYFMTGPPAATPAHRKERDERGTVPRARVSGAPARFLVILGLVEFVGKTFIF